jgi:hypothetical protein
MSNKKVINQEVLINTWEIHKRIISTFINEDRSSKILKMIDSLGENYLLSPASSKDEYHNSFTGGYLDHVNRVVKFSLKQMSTFEDLGFNLDFTKEELVFTALFHKLGKIGEKDTPLFIPQEDDWRRRNLKENYTVNPDIEFMSVPDRGLYLLQLYGIQVSRQEYLGIKLYNGLYDDSNKPYFFNRNENYRLKTDLPFIVHTAEKMATIYEYRNSK